MIGLRGGIDTALDGADDAGASTDLGLEGAFAFGAPDLVTFNIHGDGEVWWREGVAGESSQTPRPVMDAEMITFPAPKHQVYDVINETIEKNEIPTMLLHRYLSLRVYDDRGMMIDAKTVEGINLEGAIQNIFSNATAQYIQVHNARPGCYNCQIDRIPEGPGSLSD